MRAIIILLSILFLTINVKSQPNNNIAKGKISGKTIDAVTKLPVDYATISVFRQGEANPFNGISSDPKGNFTVSGIPSGDYRVTVDFVGYQRKTFDHVIITNNNVSLGNIFLMPVQNQLKSVTITAKTPIVENKIDRLVYNAANDLTSQGGVAIDVLKKVPMVTVDIDGNVELQGNANIRFLINGKPSSIFGASLSDALQSIPASQIKSIEVITSPGAKYDASGTGGIINIILKDSKVQGINGSVNLSAGTRWENGSFNLNAKKNNFGMNAYFSGNEQLNTTSINTTDRTSSDTNGNITHLLQKGNSEYKRSSYQSGLSLNWSITKKDELTASVGFNHFGNNSDGITNQEEQKYAAGNLFSDILSVRNSNSHFSANSTDWSVDYKKTFKKENQELEILYTSSFGKNTTNFFQEQDYLTGGRLPSGSIANNPGKDKQTNISIDYTQPVTKNFTLETGAKAIFEDLNNIVNTDTLLADGSYVHNANQTYGFNYNRKIFAYYLSSTFSLFNNFLDGKIGMRYEYTSVAANTNIPGYGILAPSFVFSHKFDQTQSIKFSYTYRLQRPDYRDLNPFYNISDPHNISTGNPNLKPELGHNYELGYNKSYDKGANFYIGAFYHYNTDDIQSYTTPFDTLTIGGTTYTNVLLNQRYNIGSQSTTGISLYGSLPVTDRLNLRSNTYFGDRVTNNPGSPRVNGISYHINLNISYQFKHDLTAEAFINYHSSQKGIQGTSPSFMYYYLAMRKQFLNKKASIGLSMSNPFNKYVNQKGTTFGPGFEQTYMRQIPLRSFGISLSYRFGKLEFKKDKEKEKEDNIPSAPDN